MIKNCRLLFLSFYLLFSCKEEVKQFELLDANVTQVQFENTITEDNDKNVLTYEYFYNGGGVATGDLNNDGLMDLYFTANMGEDALYLNNGDLTFKNVTKESGIQWNGEWKTGVTFVDINQDGLLDIYLSCSGNEDNEELRRNKLYLNQGAMKFKESASEYGLDSPGFTTHAAFFDYDRDGDLDAYIMNHNVEDFKRFDVAAIHEQVDEYAGDQLLRNDNGKFTDVSLVSGIKRNPIGFGLGLHIADINGDHWPDIYISNDYIEADYLYINQQDGTFKDEINNKLDHNSYFSMGNDIADVNNDLLPDIFTSDMLPEDNKRQKLLFGPEKYEGYLAMLRNGFLPEVMRNMLHINNGDGTFSEMGQLAGVSNTDWSWSPLWADYNNDGYKDLFVTNGYLRDYTNNDFIKFYAEERREGRDNVVDIINKMPSTQLSNYVFSNTGDLYFENKTSEWGLDQKKISNGAVYVDLDNDGDLEIVTNNINQKASIYKNTTKEKSYLKVKLNGIHALNAKVMVYAGDLRQYVENTSVHGFQSSNCGPLHFGLGSNTSIDSVVVIWNNGQSQKILSGEVQVNTTLELTFTPGNDFKPNNATKTIFEPLATEIFHGQQEINDFSRQILLPYMYSYQGPALASGDIDNDGLKEVYLGGGKGAKGRLYKKNRSGTWVEIETKVFKQDELCTDSDAHFVDIDGDKDLDLLVISSGFEYLKNDFTLQNRIYLNDGSGSFTKSQDILPPHFFADSKAVVFDFDTDGDMDVFVGGYVIPQAFPDANPSRLYENIGGKLVEKQNSPFKNLGIVTDALTLDYDADGDLDLLVSQEWGELLLFENNNGTFLSTVQIAGSGLWQSLDLIDIDGDGKEEILAGNFGFNSQLKANENEPMRLHIGDFDSNGRSDVLLSTYIKGVSYPFFSRDEVGDQLPVIKKHYPTYESYSLATTEGLLSKLGGKVQKELEVTTLKSSLIQFDKGVWTEKNLPVQFQAAPIYDFEVLDANQDGAMDILVGGNNYRTRVRLGNLDANHGQLYLNNGKGEFNYIPNYLSGLNFLGDVRSLNYAEHTLWVGINAAYIQRYVLD